MDRIRTLPRLKLFFPREQKTRQHEEDLRLDFFSFPNGTRDGLQGLHMSGEPLTTELASLHS